MSPWTKVRPWESTTDPSAWPPPCAGAGEPLRVQPHNPNVPMAACALRTQNRCVQKCSQDGPCACLSWGSLICYDLGRHYSPDYFFLFPLPECPPLAIQTRRKQQGTRRRDSDLVQNLLGDLGWPKPSPLCAPLFSSAEWGHYYVREPQNAVRR